MATLDNIRKHPQNSQNIVGSGPFKLKEFKPGEYIIMERFEDYFIEGRAPTSTKSSSREMSRVH